MKNSLDLLPAHLIEEITKIVFEEADEKFQQPCDVIFVFGKILVVCKNYGAGRQCRTLRKQIGTNIKVVPYPFETNAGSNGPIITRHNWTNDPICQELVFREMLKIYKYGRLGHLEAVDQLSEPLEEILKSSV